MRLPDALQSVADRIRIDFDETATLQHSSSKGRARESSIVSDFLSKYVPGNVAVEQSGEIIAVDGSISPECDILILDPRTPKFWERAHAFRVVPVECVHGIVEVKSNLDSRELKSTVEKVAAIKRLRRDGYYEQVGIVRKSTTRYGQEWPFFPALAIVFAFRSIALETLADTLVEAQRTLPVEHRIDGVFVLDRGMLIYAGSKGLFDLGQESLGRCSLSVIESDNPLFMMTALMHRNLQGAWMPPFNLSAYLSGVSFGDLKRTILNP